MNNRNLTPFHKYITIGVLVLIAAGSIMFEEARIDDLRDGASTYAEMVEAMVDTKTGIIIVRSGSQNIDKANEDACKLLGYDKGELEGLPITELVPQEYLPQHNKSYGEAMEKKSHDSTPRVVPIACYAKRKDDTFIPCVIRLYIGKNGILALINHNDQSKYLPMDKMGELIKPEAIKGVKTK